MWNWLWFLPCPKKIQVFLWKPLRNRLPTKTFLALTGANIWTLFALVANLLKPLFTFSETVLGQEKSGAKLQEYCPFPSSLCHYKTGFNQMPIQRGLPILISSLGKSYFRSLAGNFGLPVMREYLTISPPPNMPSYILRCKQPLNSISWQAPSPNPRAGFLIS